MRLLKGSLFGVLVAHKIRDNQQRKTNPDHQGGYHSRFHCAFENDKQWKS